MCGGVMPASIFEKGEFSTCTMIGEHCLWALQSGLQRLVIPCRLRKVLELGAQLALKACFYYREPVDSGEDGHY